LRRLRKLVCDAGHPRLSCRADAKKTWMAGSSPAMTKMQRFGLTHFSFVHPALAHSSFTIRH